MCILIVPNFLVSHLWGEIINLDVFHVHTSEGFHKKQREGNHTVNNEYWWMNEWMNGFILNKRLSKQMYFPSNQEDIYQINMKTYMNNMISRNNQTCFLCIFFSYGNHYSLHAHRKEACLYGQATMGLWETTCVCDVQREGPLWQHLLQVCDGSFVEGVLVIDAFFPHWFSQGLRILCPYNSGPQALHPVPQYNLNSTGK